MMNGKPPVLVVMGVSGSGKSTIASLLAGRLGWDLQEGDDLHPPANVAKMASGLPLTDDDRWPWLERVAAWVSAHAAAGQPGVITCSALRRIYRDRLRGEGVVFIYLILRRDQLNKRLTARLDHYMPLSLLASQIATLEPPGNDENVLLIEATGLPAVKIADAVINRLALVDDS